MGLLMMKRNLPRILITLIAMAMATQVLYGQIICDLMASMPCCMSDTAPTTPSHPVNPCDECVVSAPISTSAVILESTFASNHSGQALPTLHPEAKAQVAGSSSAGLFPSETSNPSLLPTYNTPETLSTFRI